jgi:hypothetical protein
MLQKVNRKIWIVCPLASGHNILWRILSNTKNGVICISISKNRFGLIA